MTGTANDRDHLRLIRNPLSPQETRLLQEVADGRTRPEIAERHHIKPETVKSHLRMVRRKTGKRSVLLAVVMALRARWIR